MRRAESLKDKKLLALGSRPRDAGCPQHAASRGGLKAVMTGSHWGGRQYHLFIDEDAHADRRRQGPRVDDASQPAKPAAGRGANALHRRHHAGRDRKHVEKDAAMARRFQPIFVSETPRRGIPFRSARPADQVRRGSTTRGITDPFPRWWRRPRGPTATSPTFLPDRRSNLMDEAAAAR